MDLAQFRTAARQTLTRPTHFDLPEELPYGADCLAEGISELPIAADVRGGLLGGLLTWLQYVQQATVNAIPVLPQAASSAPPAAAESLPPETPTPADSGDPRGPIGPILDAATPEPDDSPAAIDPPPQPPAGDPVTALLATLNSTQ